MGLEEDLEAAKKRLKETPVNKATEKDRARIKAKIASLKEQKEKRAKETGGGYDGYAVEKTGDATVSLVGYPSVGKSTLLNKLTNAESEVGNYHFTTLNVVPGVMKYRGASIQILDVPGLIGGAAKGKGDGKQVLSVVRNSDMVVLMTDPERLHGFDKMEDELYDAGIRVDMEPPNIKVDKKGKGGIQVKTPVELTKTDEETVREVMKQWGYTNASIIIREDCSIERVIDALARNRLYIPSLKVVNKAETLDEAARQAITDQYGEVVFISAEEGDNLEAFQKALFRKLGLIRIYMKKRGQDADTEEPMMMKEGSTIEDLCKSVHDQFLAKFKQARIWGSSAQFDGQVVGLEHVLQDEDIVEINKN